MPFLAQRLLDEFYKTFKFWIIISIFFFLRGIHKLASENSFLAAKSARTDKNLQSFKRRTYIFWERTQIELDAYMFHLPTVVVNYCSSVSLTASKSKQTNQLPWIQGHCCKSPLILFKQSYYFTCLLHATLWITVP